MIELILSVYIIDIERLVHFNLNPVKDILKVKSDIPILIKIFNLNGAEIKSIELDLGVNSIDLSRFNNGFYILSC